LKYTFCGSESDPDIENRYFCEIPWSFHIAAKPAFAPRLSRPAFHRLFSTIIYVLFSRYFSLSFLKSCRRFPRTTLDIAFLKSHLLMFTLGSSWQLRDLYRELRIFGSPRGVRNPWHFELGQSYPN
jgi:hypothetical protein